MELIEIKEEVKKSEALVKARYKLNPLSLKLITTLICSVQEKDTAEQEYCISIKDFAENSDYKGKSFYNNLKKSCLEIMSKPIVIGKKGSKDYLVCNWVSSCEYNSQNGLIKFSISPKLFPHILKLKERYLKYNISNILRLKSDYSIRIYELLKDQFNKSKRYNSTAEVTLTIDFLREALTIPKSYKFQNIKEQILDKAKEDLLQKTDIKFDWKISAKMAKKITHISFKIYPNAKHIKEDNKLPVYLNNFMTFVRYLREKYKGTGEFFFVSNTKINNKKGVYFFSINNKNLVYAMSLSGGNSIAIKKKKEAESVLKTCYNCAIHSELFRELIDNKEDFWDLYRRDLETFNTIISSINAAIKK